MADELLTGVRDCIARALDVDPGKITPESRLLDELGADSLDLLELLFLLETRFHVKLSIRDLERRLEQALGAAPVQVNGVYSEAALDELRRSMPEVPPAELSAGLRVVDMPRCYRVSSIVRWVERAVEEQHV